jgi:hypothetical protein
MRLAAICMAAAGCGQPRAHAGVHITPDGARLVPSASTPIAGIGVTVSE